jgi:hypothetical protein
MLAGPLPQVLPSEIAPGAVSIRLVAGTYYSRRSARERRRHAQQLLKG